MEREIKFRVWDKEENKFFQPVYEAYRGNLLDLSISLSGELLRRTMSEPCEHESRFPDRYAIMQYTGLKDDNGKDIYEGDVVVDISDNKLVVEWNDDTCKFQFSDGTDINDAGRYGSYKVIIGNIYQNSELLK